MGVGNRAVIAAAILFAAGCGERIEEPVADTTTDTTPVVAAAGRTVEVPGEGPEAAQPKLADPRVGSRIEWFDGTVDEAFAAAKAERKPVYLYWGAEWCPPCHAIKATVFRSPDFVERSRLFIPVYLDGDTENAQAAGERFGVLGYPTMIVFDADGEELTRIPGGIDLEAYANVLDLTLSNSESTRRLVARVLDDPFALTPAECSQLAYYSWQQDPAILAEREAADAFREMYTRCPETLERERSLLYMAWLGEKLSAADGEDDVDPLSAAERTEALTQVRRILDDAALARENVFAVNFLAADLVAALTEPGSEARQALIGQFRQTYDRLFADESLYKRERIYTLMGRIDLERIDDPDAPLSDELEDRIRETAVWADESTPDPYERQPIINAMGNVLAAAGMNDLRRELLLAELEVSKQPYYFMTGLAGVEQAAGNTEAALEWLRKGWEASTGPATRFQWGYYYLDGLLEMAPEDAGAIRDTTIALIDELQSGAGFYQRPKGQLARLETALTAWGEENDTTATLAEIRASVLEVCRAEQAEESRRVCEAFLDNV